MGVPSSLAEFQSWVSTRAPDAKKELDAIIAEQLTARWLPDPDNKPQTDAYYSKADILLYGGAAGAGKTSLLVGLGMTQHRRSVIFRAKATDLQGVEEYLLEVNGSRDGWNGADNILRRDGRSIQLAHLEKPGSEKSHQGRPRDFYGFDEGAQLARTKVQFVIGWLRSEDPRQRKRIVIASNPPTGGEGEWLMEWFAPWLDKGFGNPAKPGELRWAATGPDRDGSTVWLKDGSPIVFTEGLKYRLATQEEIEAQSAQGDTVSDVVVPKTRTFIPGRLNDNKYLRNTGYRTELQNLPEPLRSQLLHGDFTAGRQDHEWQVIPTAWVRAAQARWTPEPPEGAQMTAIAADIAQGGADDFVAAPRHGPWYAELIVRPGASVPLPSDSAALIVKYRRNNCAIVVDMGGGYGGGVAERLEENDIEVRRYNGANGSDAVTADKARLKFINKRAEVHWRFREALDPDQDGGSQIALPPDPALFADLTAPRWKLSKSGIQIEGKEDLKKPERLGRSPDRGDAVIMAWSEGEKAIIAAVKRGARLAGRAETPKLPDLAGSLHERATGWMGR